MEPILLLPVGVVCWVIGWFCGWITALWYEVHP